MRDWIEMVKLFGGRVMVPVVSTTTDKASKFLKGLWAKIRGDESS